MHKETKTKSPRKYIIKRKNPRILQMYAIALFHTVAMGAFENQNTLMGMVDFIK